MSDEAQGGRIFFSSTGRSLDGEDEIVVLSVGVDIGSSTSHLVFSRIVLERLDSRYVVTKRETFHEFDILLTPYSSGETIDSDALGAFIEQQYTDAKIDPDEIDTGALILTGVAVRRSNARAIGELFARQAGKMVAVSAGDSLETVMAAYGSGAAARSIRDNVTVMNVDIGGGTSKIAVCAEGKVVDLTAVDVGARLVCVDDAGKIVRIEEAGRRFAAELGIKLEIGAPLSQEQARALASRMADRLFEAMKGGTPSIDGSGLCRIDPLKPGRAITEVTFSGGVSEYIYGREAQSYGDLGVHLAEEIRARLDGWGPTIEPGERRHPRHRDRRLAIHHAGFGQHDLRVADGDAAAAQRAGDRAGAWRSTARSSTAPPSPTRSRACCGGSISAAATARSRCSCPGAARRRSSGSTRSARARSTGSPSVLAKGHPIVLAGDGDVGGLLGIHLREEMKIESGIVSIDGLELKDFDYIDIGTMLPASGAVPVVIKSLIFPTSAATGKEWQPAPRAVGETAAAG